VKEFDKTLNTIKKEAEEEKKETAKMGSSPADIGFDRIKT
jgi:hypothetical protein